ncbi:mRNA surveillance protein pelota [Halocatena pleomorpha]|uniref:Protein pelota homolog n=1 Tax=Halocatena pleomorpha TaxID=1785090 RepID=A0A3P3R8N6_9EURY|nr:mRNA surveillance protein pelota [Halocatena pleomorpha]RRJ29766.1 mRNA surveillance protein pelota [Halocatena pleomorpha]
MRISDRAHVEGEREQITVVPESTDDLWHLSNVLEPGDAVGGDTHRRVRRNDEQLRDTGGEREHMFATIEVESVEFARFANRLRVSGVIVDCSREDQLDFHHTLNVEENEEVEITKRWKPDQLDRLTDAVEASENPDVAIATVEEGAAHVHTVAQYGAEERASLTGPTGKGDYARSRTELFAELTAVLSRMDVDAIILAGPGFTKQDAYAYIEENARDLVDLITLVDTSAVGDRGVHEVLKRGAVEDVQAETRIAREAELIDRLMTEIAQGAKATYGIDGVREAAEYGAIETLLVVDDRLREERGRDGDWDQNVNELLETVDQKGGDIVVFSGEYDPGEQLSNLGGIAAILRYRLE